MSSERVVNVPIVMAEYARSLELEKIQIKRKMKYGWFMDYSAVRAVVGYGIETVMVRQISTK
jgi:hypothetical protein